MQEAAKRVTVTDSVATPLLCVSSVDPRTPQPTPQLLSSNFTQLDDEAN